MADDLIELRGRIEWTRGQITILASQMLSFIQGGGFVRTTETIDGRTTIYVARGDLAMPLAIRIETGHIIHELRTVLDALACVLAERNGQTTKDVYFPISKDLAVFETDGMRKIKKLSLAHQAIIVALKPYAEGNPPLFALHSCDLLRKHTRLIPATDTIGTFNLVGGDIRSLDIHPFGPITKTPRPVVGFDAKDVLAGDVSIDIQFSEPSFVKGQPVLPVLRKFTSLVESIIELFA